MNEDTQRAAARTDDESWTGRRHPDGTPNRGFTEHDLAAQAHDDLASRAVAAADPYAEIDARVVPNVEEDVKLALDAVLVAITNFTAQYGDRLNLCTASSAQRLVMRFALTYLVSEGLVTVAAEGAYERFLPLELSEPHAAAIARQVDEAVAARARWDAAARR